MPHVTARGGGLKSLLWLANSPHTPSVQTQKHTHTHTHTHTKQWQHTEAKCTNRGKLWSKLFVPRVLDAQRLSFPVYPTVNGVHSTVNGVHSTVNGVYSTVGDILLSVLQLCQDCSWKTSPLSPPTSGPSPVSPWAWSAWSSKVVCYHLSISEPLYLTHV